MKKIAALTLGLAMGMAFAACGAKGIDETEEPIIGGDPATWGPTITAETEDEADGEITQIANPFTECETLEEAAGLAGFSLQVPDALEGYSNRTIQVLLPVDEAYTYVIREASEADATEMTEAEVNEDALKAEPEEDHVAMIEVIYDNGIVDDTTTEDDVRIRKALGSDDISGDYNVYDTEATYQINDCSVTMKGNGSLVSVALWTEDGYTYAIDASNFSQEEMAAIVAQVK